MLDHRTGQLVPQLETDTEMYFAPQLTQNWQPSESPDKWVKQHIQM